MSWVEKNWKPLTVVGGLLGLSWFAGKRFEEAETFDAPHERMPANSTKKTIEDLLRGDRDLAGADLRNAKLRKANLPGADLRGADLRNADLREAYFYGANLRDANLEGADLRMANLEYADLRSANLRRANLRVGYLRRANLMEAKLQNADLMYANLLYANVKDADFRGAVRLTESQRARIVEGGGKFGAETFDAERIKYDFIVHREPKGTKIGKDGKRIPNPKGGWFKSVKDAETFEAYDPMMQNRIDRNECSHNYYDGDTRLGDAWVLKYADLMGVEDGMSYIEAGVRCGICGQERVGSWAINEREGFQITKGEEGRMPRFYGFYGAETFEAPYGSSPYGRMPAWRRGKELWNKNHLVWASDSKAVREAIKTAFPEQKFSVRIVNGQYIEVVAKSGTRPADIEQFRKDVEGVAMKELGEIYKDSPEELREKRVYVHAYARDFEAEPNERRG